jgi:general secretion pathway protein D
MSRRARLAALLPAMLALALAACHSFDPYALQDPYRSHYDALKASGDRDAMLDYLASVMRASPTNARYRAEYIRVRDAAVAEWLAVGDAARRVGQFDAADQAYRTALRYDPENARVLASLRTLDVARQNAASLADARKLLAANDLAAAEAQVRAVLARSPDNADGLALKRTLDELRQRALAAPPTLGARAQKPITLELRDASLRMVFEAISRTSGINFVFDRDIRPDQRTTIFVRDTPIAEVIRILGVTNQIDQKILNDNTVLLYPSTPAKLREYQELIVRSFFLANADPKQTANMLRTILKTRDVFVDEKINLVVIRDTPEAVRLAEKLVSTQDMADPEVMLEVEVLEISQTRLQELGIRWPFQAGFGVNSGSGTTGGIGVGALGAQGLLRGLDFPLTGANWYITVTDPLFLFNLRQTDGASNLLANPRIRVKNRDKARVLIGDRVPVITTTAAATGGFVSQSVTYIDVGLKLEVEPLIQLENEVGIKVGLEVSSIVREIRTGVGANQTLAYQIGTRTAATNLRLRDGETQVLGGLIADDERKSAERVPGLGNYPNIGRLFSSQRTDRTKTEIVMLITPRVVRGIVRPDAQMTEFSAGTEASIGGGFAGRGRPRAPDVAPPPPQPEAPAQPVPIPGATQLPFGGINPPVYTPGDGTVIFPGVTNPPAP